MLLPQESCRADLYGKEGKREQREEKNERWRVYKKEVWSLKSSISGDFPPVCFRILSGWFLTVRLFSHRQHDVKYSVIKRRSQYHWTLLFFSCLCLFSSLFSLTFLFVPVCMSEGRKAKGLFPYRNSQWFMFPLLWSASCVQPRDKPFQVV